MMMLGVGHGCSKEMLFLLAFDHGDVAHDGVMVYRPYRRKINKQLY